ncbi:MAG TPA: amino acid permease [Bryobacteraceae bacterium]|nr:amino acid permease [Bryobacteraceae bacterium]
MASSSPTTGLLRQIGLLGATALVFSNMIGTGIFTTSGYLAGDLGDPALVIAIWGAGALIALAGALCYSELGINFPSSGGEYVYLTEAYGPTWGFMDGWVSFFAGFSAPVALASLAFSEYLSYVFPALRIDNTTTFGPLEFGPAQLTASALILVFTIVNFFGIQFASNVQNVLSALKLAVLAGFLVLGFALGKGDWSHFSQTAVRTSNAPIWQQFASSLIFIFVAYSGWNAATYVAEELREPEKTLPRALTLGTVFVAGLYALLNLLYIYATPLEQMKGVLRVGSQASERLFGDDVATLFSVLMAAGLLASVNALVTIGPRVYYAMAKNRAFFPAAARVHEKWRTPVASIAMQGVCAVFMCLTPFRDLMFYVGFLLNAFAALAVASLFVFRKRAGWRKLPVVSFGWPLLPLFFLVCCAWVAVAGILLRPSVSMTALATVALGAFVYKVFLAARPAGELATKA